jgi:hypothetical protein
MFARVLTVAVLSAVAGVAHADIYTWVDKSGLVNVSNLPPPEGVRVTKVQKEAPKDPAREAAREAARQAEMRALAEQVQQLQVALEQSRREPPAMALMPPPMAYGAPSPPATTVINMVSSQPAYPSNGGCDYGWGDCGLGWWPGYYPAAVYPSTFFVGRGKNFRRNPAPHAQPYQYPGQIVPPLITPMSRPLPPPRKF